MRVYIPRTLVIESVKAHYNFDPSRLKIHQIIWAFYLSYLFVNTQKMCPFLQLISVQ